MKKTLMCWMIFLFVMPGFVFAHTELEESTPQDEATVEEPIEEIELIFSTELEEQSTFELIQENGETIPASMAVESSVLTIGLEEPLPNGSYTAEWLVVGEDGHPVEGELSFEVAGQEEAASGEETEESDQAAEETVIDEGIDTNGSEENSQDDSLVNEQVDTQAGDQGMSTALIIVLLVVGAIAVFSGIWLARRKR